MRRKIRLRIRDFLVQRMLRRQFSIVKRKVAKYPKPSVIDEEGWEESKDRARKRGEAYNMGEYLADSFRCAEYWMQMMEHEMIRKGRNIEYAIKRTILKYSMSALVSGSGHEHALQLILENWRYREDFSHWYHKRKCQR